LGGGKRNHPQGRVPGQAVRGQGEIIRLEPQRLLEHSHWSPLSGKTDSPENYQQVTWQLSERDGGTELTITEHNLPSEQAKEVSDESWKTVLTNLKEVLEE
jgi:uncharacterized protein YndB with AHSA1/START domain